MTGLSRAGYLLEPNLGSSLVSTMAKKAQRERPGAQAEDGANVEPSPEDCEKLRLRFELELLGSQNAGASLDPLLRRTADESGQASKTPDLIGRP